LPYRKERNPNANKQGQFTRKKYGENHTKTTPLFNLKNR